MPQCPACGSEIADSICPSCDATVASTTPVEVPAAAPGSRQSRASQTRPGYFASPNDGRFVPGEIIGERYRIIALLGKGGMGEVYRADDLTLGQQVALKFLPGSMTRNEDALRRFHNEVRIARKVSHPNVCRVYDVGEVDGRMFLSMEYVDGEDLGSLLRRIGSLPAGKALEISRKLCAGLAAAHDKGVLHRDLKPANVMLDSRGQVLLTDFGLAGLAEEITGIEVRSGTPAYMSPEQLSGKEVTVQSDIYSLGLVIYELFSGKRPFEANSLDELIRLRTETTPASLNTLVRDLDPAVERVVLRCLDSNPAQRPKSALSVAASLPGGDPLAAALAAGETPSPQMVAAAGEGEGLSPRIAIPAFAGILIGLGVLVALWLHRSALEKLDPQYPPEVLAQKAMDVIKIAGYAARPFDRIYGFDWESGLIGHASQEKPFPGWPAILSRRPAILSFWYRQSPWALTALSFHDDLLTPGVTGPEDPPSIYSGMVDVRLDANGHLLAFQAIPDQELPAETGSPRAPDWNALFAAAGLDPAGFQPTEPLRTWPGTSDVRAAWTGWCPGGKWPLRVEAAALRGKPIAFALIGPWNKPERSPAPESLDKGAWFGLLLGLVFLTVLAASAVLARRNLASGRGDRRGAFRIAVLMFSVLMMLWLTRSHISVSMGTLGMFLLAICTAAFQGLMVWTVYLALEPYVRRFWPHSIISWTRALNGQIRDPIVGRDALVGIGASVISHLIVTITILWMERTEPGLGLTTPEILLGPRRLFGLWLMSIPHGLRETLIFFFTLFLFRAVFRKPWLAGVLFIMLWNVVQGLQNDAWIASAVIVTLEFGLVVVVMLRFGLLALAIQILASNLLRTTPTLHASSWYFLNADLTVVLVAGFAAWALYTSMRNRLPALF